MGKFIDLTGMKFGRLTVVRCLFRGGMVAETGKKRNTTWECKCDCGKTTSVTSQDLLKGKSKSCGCLRAELHTKHGGSDTSEYHTWEQIVQRCTNKDSPRYKTYGGRGITVCERWLEFENFIRDMGPRPTGQSIERVDNDKGYEPTNCIWAEASVQHNNTTKSVRITYNGRTQTRRQWSRELGIPDGTIRKRLLLGWSMDKALSTPINVKFRGAVK